MKKILQFFKQCPAFSAISLREDFLAPEAGSAAIVPDGGDEILRRYTSGDVLGQFNIKLLLREGFTGEAGQFFEMLSDWIEEGGTPLPELGGNKTAQYVEVVEGPKLIKTEVGAGIYEMKFRLVYYRKGVTV